MCVFLLAAFAYAQQYDVAVSGSTILASSPPSDLAGFNQPVQKGGTFVGLNADFVGFRKRRFGLSAETAWRYRKEPYPFNGESYRPIFSDVNVLYQPRLSKKLGLDLMGGVGIATTAFSLPGGNSCSSTTGCINYTSSNHFMEHIGGGVRYRVWRRFFVRPEINYYHVQNYVEFHTDNVIRMGASLGYTFAPR